MISVCIPVFNGARYIGETLESLSRQTYRDFEVIVSDNASTDGTADVVASWKNRLPRLRYSRNERNLGYCANVAKAVSVASSDIVAIYHADDVYEPEILEKEARILENNPEIAGIFTRTIYYGGKGVEEEDFLLPAELRKFVPYDSLKKIYAGKLEDYAEAFLRYGNFFACPSFMTKKTIFQRSGGFTDDYPTSEDLHLWIRLLEAGHTLAIIDQPLVRYRISEAQGSAALRRHQNQSISFSVMDKFLTDRPFIKEEALIVYRKRKVKDLMGAAMNAYRLGDRESAKDHVRESRSVLRLRDGSKHALAQKCPWIVLPVAAVFSRLSELKKKRRWNK